MISRIVCMVAILAIMPSAVGAQQPDRQALLLAAAMKAVLHEMPAGRVALEAFGLPDSATAQLVSDFDRLYAIKGPEEVLQCSPTRGFRECTMTGATGMIRVRAVNDSGPSPRIVFELLTPTSSGGIYLRGVAVTLQERDRTWVATGIQVLYHS